MTGQRWVRSSPRSLSRRLATVGHAVSPPTVGRLLGNLDFARHVNAKQVEAHAQTPERDQQFVYIADQRAAFAAARLPIVSVDTKKKDLVGNFKNAEAAWGRVPERVSDAEMAALNLERHAVCPTWNYTLRPRVAAPDQELIP